MRDSVYAVVLVFFGGLVQAAGIAQNAEGLDSKYKKMIDSIRAKQYAEGFTDTELKNADPNQFLQVLKPYQDDPDWMVRRHAYKQACRLAKIQNKPGITREVVQQLVRASTTGSLQEASQWLLTFTKEDFSPAARQMLKEGLQSKSLSKPQILICGVADMQEIVPDLEEMLTVQSALQRKGGSRAEGFNWFYTEAWAARLARARMGAGDDIAKSIQIIEGEINRSSRFELLHDLAYIRQPQAVESLRRYFLSDRRLPTTNPDITGETWSHYMMPILDEVLVNFPVKKTENQKLGRLYSDDEVETARKWIQTQKTWEIRR
ncbi:MAG TPA: hypothetical protein PKB02_05370 [Anaerohalosphaeraceae bacterium]|nr:hypothetical protein [Anaerohalosphaeraceae bacterium]